MNLSHSSNTQSELLNNTAETAQLDTSLSSNQQIHLLGNDTSNTYPIYGRDVEIFSSKNSLQPRINASNKIKVNKIVNFEWEQRYNHGNLIAVHKSGLYFAYSIRVENNGKVKVFNKKLNEKVLLKSFKGRVLDLSFAHFDAQILLGCVDESGCTQIFQISLDQDSKMQTTVLFNLASVFSPLDYTSSSSSGDSPLLNKSKQPSSSSVARIIWCMYIPDVTNNGYESGNSNPVINVADDASKVFALTRRNRIDIFHLDLVEENYDCSEQLETENIHHGHLVIDDQESNILSGSFSPDGSAVAFSTNDGEVCFYKINFQTTREDEGAENEEEEDRVDNATPKLGGKNGNRVHAKPKYLQKWSPHKGKPVTSLYFLDDIKNSTSDSIFWNFVVTGADFNREIKLWCCDKWECLQTIRFSTLPTPPGIDSLDTNKSIGLNSLPAFKTSIDATSTYLVLSDITRKCFYVLHLFKDSATDQARCTACSEYILAYPALSFAIIDSFTKKARKYNQLNNVNNATAMSADEGNYDSLSENMSSMPHTIMSSSSSSSSLHQSVSNETTDLVTMIRMYCIQTKQLQEMQIFLTGEQSINAYNNSSNSPPPAIVQPIPFPYGSNNQSILNQLLPGTSPTTNGRFKLLKDSNNLISSDTETANNSSYEAKLTSSQSIIRSLLPNLKPSISSNNFNSEEDSAIIQIVTPTPQMPALNVATTPLLLTPDAFINSPTNSKNSHNSEKPVAQASTNSTDILQSLFANNNNNNSTNASTNLMSSRTSSLTHVTNTTILAPNVTSAFNTTDGPQQKQQQQQQKKLKTKKEKKLSPLHQTSRVRKESSSSSCSSCSSSCSTGSRSDVGSSSESSTASSIMDLADKEIAALSNSGTSNKLVAQLGSSSSSSATKMNGSQTIMESLLNKVSIDNDDSVYMCKGDIGTMNKVKESGAVCSSEPVNELETSMGSFQIKPRPFGMNQSWLMSSADCRSGDEGLSASISELKGLLVQMTSTLRAQHEEIESLKKHQTTSHSQLKSHIDNTFKKLSSSNNHSCNPVQQQQQTSLVANESLLSNLIQSSLAKSVQPRLDKLFRDEIHKAVNSQLSTKLLEPLREQITRDLADKLKSIESVLKDSVLKLFKSKSTLDVLSQAIVNSQQSIIVNSYRETFQKVIVPNFEKSCQNMYQQVNASFSKGTQDYLIEFDTLAKQHSKKFDDARDPILVQMQKFNEGMATQCAQMAHVLAANLQQQFEVNLRSTNAVLQDTIISSVKAIIKEEIHLAMRDQSQTLPDHLINSMRQSGTMTPSQPLVSGDTGLSGSQGIWYQINQLLKKGMLNAAFQQALCAADLNLLENLCDMVSPAQAFDPANISGKGKLQQPVILSLIQQLSQDLNSNTELKVKYLEEAVVNLDMTVSLTVEHSPQVVTTLVENLQQYVQSHNDKYAKQMKMLILASNSLLQKKQQVTVMEKGSLLGQQQQQGMVGGRLPFSSNGLGGQSSNQIKKNVMSQFDQF